MTFVCGACQRETSVNNNGRVRKHLAVRGWFPKVVCAMSGWPKRRYDEKYGAPAETRRERDGWWAPVVACAEEARDAAQAREREAVALLVEVEFDNEAAMQCLMGDDEPCGYVGEYAPCWRHRRSAFLASRPAPLPPQPAPDLSLPADHPASAWRLSSGNAASAVVAVAAAGTLAPAEAREEPALSPVASPPQPGAGSEDEEPGKCSGCGSESIEDGRCRRCGRVLRRPSSPGTAVPIRGICDFCDASDVELEDVRGRGISGLVGCKGVVIVRVEGT